MQKEDTKKLLEILKTAYPHYYRNMTESEMQQTLSLYWDMFKDYPTEIVVAGLQSYIKHNEYPPTIAGLTKEIQAQVADTDIELWNEARKHIKYYITKEEFEAIPEPIKTWFGNTSNIKELATMPSETLNTVVKGQFLKTIGEVKERQIEKQLESGKSHLRAILGSQAKELPDMDYCT